MSTNLIAFFTTLQHGTTGPVVCLKTVPNELRIFITTKYTCTTKSSKDLLEIQIDRSIYSSGVNSDSSATLAVGVFPSNRVGARDLLLSEPFGST